jgi:GNAT superfamily N-acetyltransferase
MSPRTAFVVRTKRDDQTVELVERLPTADEYVELLRRVGWTSPPVEDCHRALGGSLTAICAVDEREAVVGMGRLVGDGRIYRFAVDVVVDPDAQGQGIGQAIMDALEAVVTRRRFGTRLDLVAAPDVVPFYRRLGYSQLPSDLMRKPL